jgi:hypothetical protein
MDRKSITVTKILPEVKLKYSTVYKCMAEVDGAEIKLETFDKQYGEKLVEGLKAEAEIVETPSKDGSFKNNVINQMWIDGEPVKPVNQPRQFTKNNPDERHSIESQTAVKVITELQISGADVPIDLLNARDAWLSKTLEVPFKERQRETPVKETKKPVKATTEDEKPAKAITDEDKEKADNFMAWAKNKYELGAEAIFNMLEVKNQYEIKNLSKAAKDLDALMKE